MHWTGGAELNEQQPITEQWPLHCLESTILRPVLDNWSTGRWCDIEWQWVRLWHSTAFHCPWADWTTADGAELLATVWRALSRTCWTLLSHCESFSTDARWCLHWRRLQEHVHGWATATQEEEQVHCPMRGSSYWPYWRGQRGAHWTSG